MKVIVNKSFFLKQALPIPEFRKIALSAYGGRLAVASYGNTVNFRVPADVIDSGQVDLTFEEWQQLLAKVQQSLDAMVTIEL